jgi:hypothetical protein
MPVLYSDFGGDVYWLGFVRTDQHHQFRFRVVWVIPNFYNK